jgi:hypothetical protein
MLLNRDSLSSVSNRVFHSLAIHSATEWFSMLKLSFSYKSFCNRKLFHRTLVPSMFLYLKPLSSLHWFIIPSYLKGHGNEADYLGFLQKLVPHESLTLSFGPFRFWFKFAEIFVFEKWLPVSLISGVGNTPHHRYRESAIEFFKRKLSVSMIRRVVDSPHQWYGESPTPCIVE